MVEDYEDPWTGLYIFPDAFSGTPMAGLDTLRDHISPCRVRFTPDGSILAADLDNILGRPGGSLLTNLYDRSPLVDDWYYSLYAVSSTSSDHRTTYDNSPNPIVDAIMPKGSAPVLGPVLVVLDGPAEGMWEVHQIIDQDRFARTVWWYFKLGNDVSQVYGEREYQRFIKTFV